jgi:hypothetical protein
MSYFDNILNQNGKDNAGAVKTVPVPTSPTTQPGYWEPRIPQLANVPSLATAQSTPAVNNNRKSLIQSLFQPRAEAVPIRRAFEATPVMTKAPPIVTTAADLGYRILEAVPRLAATVGGEILGKGKPAEIKANIDLRRLGFEDPKYQTAAKEQVDAINKGENPWLSGLRIVSNKTLDVAFGAQLVSDLAKLTTGILLRGGVEARTEAQNVVDAYAKEQKQVFSRLKEAPLAEREKVLADLANTKTQAQKVLAEIGKPTTVDRVRVNTARYTDVLGRQTPMGTGYWSRMLKSDMGVTLPTPSPTKISGQLPGYVSEGTPFKAGLSIEPVKPVGFVEKTTTPYAGEKDLTTKLLTRLEGRSSVSKQFISDLTNASDLKQTEKDIVRSILDSYPAGANIAVKDFADKVKQELLPLSVLDSTDFGSGGRYEGIALPPEQRGEISTYRERVYESPVKTSAGDTHFGGEDNSPQNYFGHVRMEDVAGGDTRRIIEVQSDLYQKGRLEQERGKPYSEPAKNREEMVARFDSRQKGIDKLAQYNNPTAHFRMVREEVKQAAIDGKTKLQFPTGETAMKIEGLGQRDRWYNMNRENTASGSELAESQIEVGKQVADYGGNYWVITDVLGDSKFKAIPKVFFIKIMKEKGIAFDQLSIADNISYAERHLKDELNANKESFDISGKVDTNNPIYKFYEKDLGRYLKNTYDAKIVTDAQGVKWYEVDIKPEMANQAITAFSKDLPGIFGRGKINPYVIRRTNKRVSQSENPIKRGASGGDSKTGSITSRSDANRGERMEHDKVGAGGRHQGNDRQLEFGKNRKAGVEPIEEIKIVQESFIDQYLFSRGKISRETFIDNIHDRAVSLGVPSESTKNLKRYFSALPDNVLQTFDGIRYIRKPGLTAQVSFDAGRWSYQVNPGAFRDPKFLNGSINRHELVSHPTYTLSSNEYRVKINTEVDKILSSKNAEEIIKSLFNGSKNYVATVHSYFAGGEDGKLVDSELLYIYRGLIKLVDHSMAKSILQEIGIMDNAGAGVIFSETSALPYFRATEDVWSRIEKIIKRDYEALWSEERWNKIAFERSYSQLRNEVMARYVEKLEPSTALRDAFENTIVARASELATSDPQELFKNLNMKNTFVKTQSKELRPKVEGESAEDKLAAVRKELGKTEERVGVSPQKTMSLRADRADRLAEQKATKEIKKIKAKENLIENLKIKLSQSLQDKATELAIRKEALDANPMKALVKFMARRGEFKGRLPEVTGELGKGKFARVGDRFISEATGINNSEQARVAFDKYMDTRKKFETDMSTFSKEKQAFLKQARGNRNQIIENQKVGRSIERTERHINELLGNEATRKARLERLKQKETEAQANLKALEEARARYTRQVEAANLNEQQKKSLLAKFKTYLSPIAQTDKTTQKIYLDWEANKITGKEDANKLYDKYAGHEQNEMPDIIEYEAGANTPWIRELFDDLFTQAQRADLPVDYKDNYIPHVYREKPEQIQKAIVEYMKKKQVDPEIIKEYQKTGDLPEKISVKLKIHPSFTRIRTFPDYKTAIEYGLTPRFRTVAEHAAYYLEEMRKTIGNQKLIDDLIKEGKVLDGFDAPESWVEVRFPGRQFRTYYGPKDLAEALNGQFRDEDSLTGIQTLLKYGAKASRVMQEVTLSAGIPGTNVNFFSIGQTIKMFTVGVGELAKLNLTGASTSVKAAYAFLRANFNRASIRFLKENQKYIDLMAERNISIGRRVGDYAINHRTWKQLLTKQSVTDMKNAATNGVRDIFAIRSMSDAGKAFVNIVDSRLIGIPKDVFDKLFNEKTFTSFMPQMQIQVFKDIYNGAVKAGMESIDAADFAGKTIQAEFGLIHALGRTKTTQDALGSIFFAPKFRESIVNVFGEGARAYSTEFKNAAYGRSRSFVIGMIITFALYDLLNKNLNDGQDMWDNESGREFALRVPLPSGKIIYVEFMPSVLSFVRNMGSSIINFARGDTKTAVQKAGTLFSMPLKMGTEIIANKDYFGRPIYDLVDSPSEKAKKVIQYMGLGVSHPYFRELVRYYQGKQDIYQTLVIASELPIKFSNEEKAAMSNYYEQKREKTELNARQRKDITEMVDTYDEVQKHKQDGSLTQAEAIINDLSDKEYDQYKMIMKYEEIQALRKNKQPAAAKQVLNALTEEEYLQYNAIKTIRTGKKRQETIQKKITGNKPEFYNGQRMDNRSFIEAIATYANAIGTDPVTAFNRIVTGQKIRRVDNGAIIVERMSLADSIGIKKSQGYKTGDELILDHTIPLELGGDNSVDNLKLVPKTTWASYTPVENHLGKLLRADKITKQEAQKLINNFKSGQIPASDIIKL